MYTHAYAHTNEYFNTYNRAGEWIPKTLGDISLVSMVTRCCVTFDRVDTFCIIQEHDVPAEHFRKIPVL